MLYLVQLPRWMAWGAALGAVVGFACTLLFVLSVPAQQHGWRVVLGAVLAAWPLMTLVAVLQARRLPRKE